MRVQRKKIKIKDYSSAIELVNLLKDVNYPADKITMLNSANHMC